MLTPLSSTELWRRSSGTHQSLASTARLASLSVSLRANVRPVGGAVFFVDAGVFFVLLAGGDEGLCLVGALLLTEPPSLVWNAFLPMFSAARNVRQNVLAGRYCPYCCSCAELATDKICILTITR